MFVIESNRQERNTDSSDATDILRMIRHGRLFGMRTVEESIKLIRTDTTAWQSAVRHSLFIFLPDGLFNFVRLPCRKRQARNSVRYKPENICPARNNGHFGSL
jgi:hypothetical protein